MTPPLKPHHQPPNSCRRRFPSYILLYLLFMFIPSISSLHSLPFLSCHDTTTSQLQDSSRFTYYLPCSYISLRHVKAATDYQFLLTIFIANFFFIVNSLGCGYTLANRVWQLSQRTHEFLEEMVYANVKSRKNLQVIGRKDNDFNELLNKN